MLDAFYLLFIFYSSDQPYYYRIASMTTHEGLKITTLLSTPTPNNNLQEKTDIENITLPAEEFAFPPPQLMHALLQVQKGHSNLALLQLFQTDES